MAMQISSKFQRPWRTAASLIIASAAKKFNESIKKNNHYDYELMLLKRSGKSKSFANQYVFPGGVIDDSDFSKDWIPIFKRTGFNMLDSNSELLKSVLCKRRMELYTDFDGVSAVPSEIAYRICAIRETFEESGILFAKNIHAKPKILDSADKSTNLRLAHVYNSESVNLLENWRNKVHRNGLEFIRMCDELEIVPDIFGLMEWSNWLTPTTIKRRFDTVFYICCADDSLDAAHDQKEMTMLQWSDPKTALENFNKGHVNFAPPQIYELSRLWQFESMKSLLEFSIKRNLDGCVRLLPIPVQLDDKYIHVFPGDDLYPKSPNIDDPEKPIIVVNGTIKERNQLDKQIHRVAFSRKFDGFLHGTLYSNCKLPDGQIVVKDINSKDLDDSKSKL